MPIAAGDHIRMIAAHLLRDLYVNFGNS